MKTIRTHINEGSSAGVELTVNDSSGTVVLVGAISSITWDLTDAAGVAINSRTDIAATVANPCIIELEPADTLITGVAVANDTRYLSVKWTYTDTVLGSGAVKTEEYALTIDRVRGI